MTTKARLEPETRLERHVATWARREAADGYDGDLTGPFRDLFYGGCQSGMVGHLIYCKDTCAFYRRHRRDIDAMLADLVESTGQQPAELFGDKWEASDPLARDTNNQNLLAWFGFEEAARRLADRAGITV